MKKDCKHVFDDRHPIYLQCTLCDLVIPVFRMKPMSKESFAELFPSLPKVPDSVPAGNR